MRVLFLDFDGVLHPASAAMRFTLAKPLQRSVQQAWLFRWAWILDELLAAHAEVGLVVHSNWRYLAADEDLRGFLGPLSRRFIGSTPLGPRWEGIAQVVQDNHLRDYRILDPVPAAFPPGTVELIACDPEVGLKDHKVQAQVDAWLRAPVHAGGLHSPVH